MWGDRFVSASALNSRLKAARRAIGDDGRAQRLIRTVHGRGYRFVAPVLERPDDRTDVVTGPAPAEPVPAGAPPPTREDAVPVPPAVGTGPATVGRVATADTGRGRWPFTGRRPSPRRGRCRPDRPGRRR